MFVKKSTCFGLACLIMLAASISHANTFSADITHDGLNRVQQVETDNGQQAVYHFRENGQLSSVVLSGTSPAQTGELPSLDIWYSPATGSTSDIYRFTADASDAETPEQELVARWDFDNDGIWDTLFDSVKEADHQFSTGGYHIVKAQVKDSDGNTRTSTKNVKVCDDSQNQQPQAVITSSVADTVDRGYEYRLLGPAVRGSRR